jgi:pimeloyl-ACP methyl ester carboxylesterase
MKPARSRFVDVRGLRYHVREWGEPSAPKLFLLHGWMDVSASFQFTVDAFARDWHVLAPDWRGFGLSQWAPAGYWFPDYIADLDALLDLLSPGEPASVVGHSMGGNVAGLYAGIRPERVARLILAEGFGLPRTVPEQAPGRYAKWLDSLREAQTLRPYSTFDEVAARLRANTPGLIDERARYLAVHWAEEKAPGRIELRADPAHKAPNPVLYRVEEAMACWRRISARTLWISSSGDWLQRFMKGDEQTIASYREAYRNLSECRIEGASHMMHHDQPERFAQAIEAFLTKAPE